MSADLSVVWVARSPYNAERDFLEHLKAAGRACSEKWLDATADDIGVRSSVNVRGTFI